MKVYRSDVVSIASSLLRPTTVYVRVTQTPQSHTILASVTGCTTPIHPFDIASPRILLADPRMLYFLKQHKCPEGVESCRRSTPCQSTLQLPRSGKSPTAVDCGRHRSSFPLDVDQMVGLMCATDRLVVSARLARCCYWCKSAV